MMQDDILNQLSDFSEWRRGAENPSAFTLLDYVGCVATPDTVLAIAELLNPTLIQHAGAWFIEARFDPGIYAQWAERLGSVREIQRVINHLHLSTLLQGENISDHVAMFVARRIADTWTATFASRGLVGEVYGNTYQNAEVTLCVRQE